MYWILLFASELRSLGRRPAQRLSDPPSSGTGPWSPNTHSDGALSVVVLVSTSGALARRLPVLLRERGTESRYDVPRRSLARDTASLCRVLGTEEEDMSSRLSQLSNSKVYAYLKRGSGARGPESRLVRTETLRPAWWSLYSATER
ncbi:hypothetical protein EDB87DRAFT_1819452 [Lactarius vividus]|nr:hypothetical protein EDB87DRAFT_1819452 [Lactarius vividus]